MDENAAASLALDAYQALEGIGEDVAQIKAGNSDVLAAIESLRQTDAEGFRQLIARDAELAIATDAPEDSNWVTEVRSSVEVPPDFFSHLMGFQYMQTVLMVFLLVAFLLNLGATLWLAFSDKWRS
ncbi:hypothetical protein [Adlercreutzia equolifaciens]|uniref:hypothetical protein n=1 Tax=Adlercreutzia equolifaciens TaxID=446660 RepID=UPI00266C3E77|nr:hypothetical protein [Adlercreutzia equolifaciens]